MSAETVPPPTAVGVRSDFYELDDLLEPRDRDLLAAVRAFMADEVTPIITEAWNRERFPIEIIPGFAKLGLGGLAYSGYGCGGRGFLVDGMVQMELTAADASVATFQQVHSGLVVGTIMRCGSDEQKQRWLPALNAYEALGSFGLTEPDVGSGIAGGLRARARREGDVWVLDGEKYWIGNATFADLNIIWARDESDEQVKGFVVEKGTPGFEATKITNKIAQRANENAHIRLSACRVPDDNRLADAHSFRATADVLRVTRLGVAWQAVGCARGAYDLALDYAKRREQFGRPIGSFQLVQDLLVRMLGNITASQCMLVQLSRLADAGTMTDEQASLAKTFTTVKMRESVGWARELLGGNGILLEHNVGRFVADAEAIYSYEGTREINTLVVGRAITGHGAIT